MKTTASASGEGQKREREGKSEAGDVQSSKNERRAKKKKRRQSSGEEGKALAPTAGPSMPAERRESASGEPSDRQTEERRQVIRERRRAKKERRRLREEQQAGDQAPLSAKTASKVGGETQAPTRLDPPEEVAGTREEKRARKKRKREARLAAAGAQEQLDLPADQDVEIAATREERLERKKKKRESRLAAARAQEQLDLPADHDIDVAHLYTDAPQPLLSSSSHLAQPASQRTTQKGARELGGTQPKAHTSANDEERRAKKKKGKVVQKTASTPAQPAYETGAPVSGHASIESSTQNGKSPEEARAGPSRNKDVQAAPPASLRQVGEPGATDAARKSKRNVQSQIDAVVRDMVAGGGSRHKGKRRETETVSSVKSKEGTLADAEHLSHREMLIDRLYYAQQLKWLEEERGLHVKKGKFSQSEQDQIMVTIRTFKKEHEMSDEDFVAWMFGHAGGDKQLYADFWRQVTASLVDRPNRAVRIFVRRQFLPKNKSGDWSSEEHGKLAEAVENLGQVWRLVANRVKGRTAEDCRLRWRDFGTDVGTKKCGPFSDEELKELHSAVGIVCEEAGLDPALPTAKIPWRLVSSRMSTRRSANQCALKWRAVLAEMDDEGQRTDKPKWTIDDSKHFVNQLSKEVRALQTDDYTEVNLSALRSKDWLWNIDKLAREWRGLVREYTPSGKDYKTRFGYNLETIKAALEAGASPRRARRGTYKPRKPASDKDEIESEEEI